MHINKILIVEDEEIIRRLFQRILSKTEYQLVLVENVTDAFKMIQSEKFDLLITDLRLPDGHGLDVIERFKEKFPNRNVIIVTGSPEAEVSIEHVLKFDHIECLCKPFEKEKLEVAIQTALCEGPPMKPKGSEGL